MADNPADIAQRNRLSVLRQGTEPGTLFRKFLPWARQGTLTIIDQGLISGSNFLISVLLARWLTAEQYGGYAIAFGFFVLLQLVYQSLVLEPMSVFGGSTYRNNLRGYFGSLLWIHVILSLAICFVFGATAGVSRLLGQTAGMPGALAGCHHRLTLRFVFLDGASQFLSAIIAQSGSCWRIRLFDLRAEFVVVFL